MVLIHIGLFFGFVSILRYTSATNCLKNLTSGTSCVAMTTTSCLGASVSFTHTYLGFANDSSTLAEVDEKLTLWSGLKAAPKCWEVIQPFLCSVYLPKCDNVAGKVEYPSKEMCEKTRDPCSIVAHINGWPWFLECEQSHFLDNCVEHTYEDDVSFNKTGQCNSPLVRTDNQQSWYEEVEGCGIQCQNPLFTEAEHDQVHTFIAVFGSFCIICTLFTILTFLIDWKNANKYPALILFFINICFFLGSIGWMAQFSGDARTDIVCKADGTIRKGEPGSGETASCVVVFIMVYYFLMAGVVWFVMLAYAWHLTFKALGTPKDALANKTSYFHIASWSIPLVLTIVCIAVSEVDGDSLSGICFVGAFNNAYRGGFVLAPIGLVLVVGLFFLCLVLRTLIKLKKDTPEYISLKASAKIKETIIRLGIFTVLAFTFVLITFSVHLYIFTNEQSWQDSFKQYLYCEANVTVTKTVSNTTTLTCSMSNRPSVAAYMIHIFAFFGAGISMSSWSWTKASLLSWERFFRKIFRKPSNKPIKLKKHKIIAKAFEKRKEINNGRLSISFASTHDDPLGMKFDLNSMSSQNSMSSDFRAAMPKLVRRRGGMFHPTAGTLRRYSDSDVGSVASKMASRRQSLDSQISACAGQLPWRLMLTEVDVLVGGQDVAVITLKGVVPPLTGIELAMEKNSMEAVSITSYSHQNSLDAATLPEPPKHLQTNFAIFTASAYMGEMQSKLQNIESTDKSEIEEPPPEAS
ncbi:hypothetical protein FSP39_020004 [Pinctada imbricata]|uniref:Protein smoothened n=1 Tax=Pinctada imbricata TaxID=66713 RepID=A0AA88XN90_PINIB|nr:hypothetical protein FSP39_020004 [Pinctada imbricata]